MMTTTISTCELIIFGIRSRFRWRIENELIVVYAMLLYGIDVSGGVQATKMVILAAGSV